MELMPVTEAAAVGDAPNSVALSVQDAENKEGEQGVPVTRPGFAQSNNDVAKVERLWERLSQLKWRNIFTVLNLSCGYLAVNAAYSIIGAFFPDEALQRGSTPLLTGIMISGAPLCVFVLSPIIGYFLPQLGLRFTSLAGLWLVGGAYILMSFVASMPSGWVFVMFCILLRMTEGVGSALFSTSLFAQLPRLFPDSIGTVNGLVEVASGVGFALGLPLGGVLFTVGGFKLPFLATGGFCLFILLLSFLINQKYDSTCDRQQLSFKLIAKLASNLTILLLAIVVVLSWASWSFIASTLQPFLSTQFHLDMKKTGLVFFIPAAVYAVLAPVVGKFTDKFGPRWLIITGCFMFGIAFFFIGPAHFIAESKLWITGTALAFFGFGTIQSVVPTFKDLQATGKSMVTEKDEDAVVNIASGIMSSSLSFGEFIGFIIGGVLTQYMDFPTSAMVFGEVILAEASLLLGATLIHRLFAR